MFLTPASGTTAVSFELFVQNTENREITITVDGTDFLLSTLARPNCVFFGLTSDSGFASITIHGAADAWVSVDNVSTGTLKDDPPPIEGGEVPEVSTWLLCGTGLFGAGMLRRRLHYTRPTR